MKWTKIFANPEPKWTFCGPNKTVPGLHENLGQDRMIWLFTISAQRLSENVVNEDILSSFNTEKVLFSIQVKMFLKKKF